MASQAGSLPERLARFIGDYNNNSLASARTGSLAQVGRSRRCRGDALVLPATAGF